MAEQGDKPKPKEDEIVAQLVPDPSQPPEPVMLAAFLGKSCEEGSTRLYFDPQLSSYIEVPDDAILHVLKVEQPLGGAYVWVLPDVEVVCGKVGPNRPRAKLMEALMYYYPYSGPPGSYYPAACAPCVCLCHPPAPAACAPCVCLCHPAPAACAPCVCLCYQGQAPQAAACAPCVGLYQGQAPQAAACAPCVCLCYQGQAPQAAACAPCVCLCYQGQAPQAAACAPCVCLCYQGQAPQAMPGQPMPSA